MPNINTADVPVFNLSTLAQFFADCIDDGVVGMVWGGPGTGKTQCAIKIAEDMGYVPIVVSGGQYAVHSAFGIVVPNLEERTSFFTMPDYIKRVYDVGEKVMLIIDEAPNADKNVTPAYLQLFDEHRIGEYYFLIRINAIILKYLLSLVRLMLKATLGCIAPQ